ncbi:MAG: hypothetical protein A3H28_03815 [Acidobacteria bacterium RIFCSPLOWO2_02_FULL_61_28]|nr:MAG: hypothetical protein A3H28_03815 [Acidobacteria bacterium RIFCSPLOWO2_02_FULL_61_28]
MKRNGRKPRIRGEVLIVNEDGLRKLIDRIARKKLGLSGQEALERIENGQAGDNFIWGDLSGLAILLR